MRRQKIRASTKMSKRDRRKTTNDDHTIKAIIHCPELIEQNKLPKMRIKKILIEIPSWQSRSRSNKLISKLREQTAMVNALWPLQEEANRKLELEVARLKNSLHELEMEAIDIKRKRWCRICEADAQFLNSTTNNFYCSEQCELQHIQTPAFTKEPESETL